MRWLLSVELDIAKRAWKAPITERMYNQVSHDRERVESLSRRQSIVLYGSNSLWAAMMSPFYKSGLCGK